MRSQRFEFAHATTTGTRHRALGKPNQDAATVRVLPGGGLVCVVADGCSAGGYSEFGARLGVAALAAAVAAMPERDHRNPMFWREIRARMLGDLRDTLRLFEDPRKAIYEYLLFTLVACIIEDGVAVFVHFGDGAIYVNGEEFPIPSEENRPRYLGYALLDSEIFPEEDLQFHVVRTLPAAELRDALIGTDGVNELAAVQAELIPGREEPVGPIDELWRDERYFANRHALQRKLNRLNPNPPPWRKGLLADDTTLFVLRQKEEPR